MRPGEERVDVVVAQDAREGSSVVAAEPRCLASASPTRVSRASVGGTSVSAPPHRRAATASGLGLDVDSISGLDVDATESPARRLDVDSISTVITRTRARRSPVAGSVVLDASSAMARMSGTDRVRRSARVKRNTESEEDGEGLEFGFASVAGKLTAGGSPEGFVAAFAASSFVAAFAASSIPRPATAPATTLPPLPPLPGCWPRFARRMSATAFRSSRSPIDAPPSSWRTTSTTRTAEPLRLRVAASTASRSVASWSVTLLSSSGRFPPIAPLVLVAFASTFRGASGRRPRDHIHHRGDALRRGALVQERIEDVRLGFDVAGDVVDAAADAVEVVIQERVDAVPPGLRVYRVPGGRRDGGREVPPHLVRVVADELRVLLGERHEDVRGRGGVDDGDELIFGRARRARKRAVRDRGVGTETLDHVHRVLERDALLEGHAPGGAELERDVHPLGFHAVRQEAGDDRRRLVREFMEQGAVAAEPGRRAKVEHDAVRVERRGGVRRAWALQNLKSDSTLALDLLDHQARQRGGREQLRV